MKRHKLYWCLAALAGLLVAAILALIVWPRSSRNAALTNLGKVAPIPRSFSIVSPGTWQTPVGTPRDWLDRGQDELSDWDHSPFGTTDFLSGYGKHTYEIRISGNLADQQEYRRLETLAKQWRENLLHRYPDLKDAPDTLPDNENGIRHLLDLIARSGATSLKLPSKLAEQLAGRKPWDTTAARVWLDSRRKLLDEVRSISGMQAGMNPDLIKEWYDRAWQKSEFLRCCGEAFCLEARWAAEQGDTAQALDSIRAVGNLARFLSSTRNSLPFCVLAGSYLHERSRNLVIQSILPRIPRDQLDLSAWEAALQPNLQTPANFAETMKAEWTGFLLTYILPTLADPAETNQPPDPEFLVEAYTRYFSYLARDHAPLDLSDLPSHPPKPMSTTGLSWRSQQLCQMIRSVNYRVTWERAQLRASFTQAAFAVLKGQTPPNDPIYGLPYRWEPHIRKLSMPKSPEFEQYHLQPIKLPKL